MPAEPVNVVDFEALAREVLPREAFDYYASGAQDEVALRANHAAYERLSLAYRVLVDVSRRDPGAAGAGGRLRKRGGPDLANWAGGRLDVLTERRAKPVRRAPGR